jgi:hypothetical protein
MSSAEADSEKQMKQLRRWLEGQLYLKTTLGRPLANSHCSLATGH